MRCSDSRAPARRAARRTGARSRGRSRSACRAPPAARGRAARSPGAVEQHERAQPALAERQRRAPPSSRRPAARCTSRPRARASARPARAGSAGGADSRRCCAAGSSRLPSAPSTKVEPARRLERSTTCSSVERRRPASSRWTVRSSSTRHERRVRAVAVGRGPRAAGVRRSAWLRSVWRRHRRRAWRSILAWCGRRRGAQAAASAGARRAQRASSQPSSPAIASRTTADVGRAGGRPCPRSSRRSTASASAAAISCRPRAARAPRAGPASGRAAGSGVVAVRQRAGGRPSRREREVDRALGHGARGRVLDAVQRQQARHAVRGLVVDEAAARRRPAAPPSPGTRPAVDERDVRAVETRPRKGARPPRRGTPRASLGARERGA